MTNKIKLESLNRMDWAKNNSYIASDSYYGSKDIKKLTDENNPFSKYIDLGLVFYERVYYTKKTENQKENGKVLFDGDSAYFWCKDYIEVSSENILPFKCDNWEYYDAYSRKPDNWI